jgi:hypothetical protein
MAGDIAMFMIRSPQTITLHTDDRNADDQPAIVSFDVDGSDTSRCTMTVTSKGRTWRAVFNTRGLIIDQIYTAPVKEGQPEPVQLLPNDYIVDGHDIRSDNPYTHVGPVTADTAYRPYAPSPGFVSSMRPIRDPGDPVPHYPAPPVDPEVAKKNAADEKAHREKVFAEAENAAVKAREERAKRAVEKPEEKVAREKQEREDRLKAAAAQQNPSSSSGYAGQRVSVEQNAPVPQAVGQQYPGGPGVVNTTETLQPHPIPLGNAPPVR